METDIDAGFKNIGIRTSRWCRLAFLVCYFDSVVFPILASAQSYEIAMQFAGMHLHKIDGAPGRRRAF